MADTHRLQATPQGLRMVSEVAAELAGREQGETSVLAVTTYFPMDVDSIARVFEGLEELEGVERVQRGAMTIYQIEDRDRFVTKGPAIEEEAFVEEAPGLLRAVGALKQDQDWVRTVRGQHELLHIVAESGKTTVELSYLTSRAKMSRARIQSVLNDFDAAGHIGVEFDEDIGELRYSFPPLEYPKQRWEHNLRQLNEAEAPARSRFSLWVFLAVFATLVLIVIILLGF